MAFDRNKFFHRANNGGSVSALVAAADEFAKLHDEIAALRNRMEALDSRLSPSCPEDMRDIDPEPRETGWAVVYDTGIACVLEVGQAGFVMFRQTALAHDCPVRWLDSLSDAETLARLLGVGRPALLYKDTLEEV